MVDLPLPHGEAGAHQDLAAELTDEPGLFGQRDEGDWCELAPIAFIPLAEETGLIRELGRQVLMSACLTVRQWQVDHGPRAPKTITVNVSPRQLQYDDIVTHVSEALRTSNLAPQCLVLEI